MAVRWGDWMPAWAARIPAHNFELTTLWLATAHCIATCKPRNHFIVRRTKEKTFPWPAILPQYPARGRRLVAVTSLTDGFPRLGKKLPLTRWIISAAKK